MHYRINARRVSFKEFRTEASLPMAALGWALTRGPNQIPSSSEYPGVDSLRPYLVRKEQVPLEALEAFEDPQAEIEAMGFRGTVYHVVHDMAQLTTHVIASLLHRSGTVAARLKYRRFEGVAPHRIFLVVEFVTPLSTGGFVVTSTSPGDLATPEQYHECFLPKASLADLWDRHRERIVEPEFRTEIERMHDAANLVLALERHHRGVAEELERRGVFEPMEDKDDEFDDEEIEIVGDEESGDEEVVVGHGQELLVAEIRKLESKPAQNYRTSLIVLVATMLGFVFVGGLAWDWTVMIYIVPILFFHEAGHFVAMKLFDYRNVQMFFIPFFGAAVAGRSYDAPGWKRIITSLMGPIPGILVGLGLGTAGVIQDNDILLKIGFFATMLNGFNLMPTLPFDGGWTLHGLFFCRHAFLDILFRLFTIAFLGLLTVFGLGRLFLFIGIALLVQLVPAFQNARIIDRLRARQSTLGVTRAGHMPESAAIEIAHELDNENPRGIGIAQKATRVIAIFQGLNAHPPGWIATITLFLVYLVSLALSIGGTAVFVLAMNSDLKRLIVDAALGPQTPLVIEEINTIPAGAEASSLSADRYAVLHFADRQSAESAFAEVPTVADPATKAVLFGQTLFVSASGPGSQEEIDGWIDRFADRAEDFFVTGAGSECQLALMCIAPRAEAAEDTAAVLAEYFAVPSELRPIAPWHANAEIAPEHSVARRTLQKIREGSGFAIDDEEMESLWDEYADANRRGNAQRRKELQEQIQEGYDRRRADFLDSLRSAPADEVDQEIVALYEQAIAKPVENADDMGEDWFPSTSHPADFDIPSWMGELAPKVGQWDEGDEAADRVAAVGGSSDHNGFLLNISVLTNQTVPGVLAVTRWLAAQGFKDFQYAIYQTDVDFMEEED